MIFLYTFCIRVNLSQGLDIFAKKKKKRYPCIYFTVWLVLFFISWKSAVLGCLRDLYFMRECSLRMSLRSASWKEAGAALVNRRFERKWRLPHSERSPLVSLQISALKHTEELLFLGYFCFSSFFFWFLLNGRDLNGNIRDESRF